MTTEMLRRLLHEQVSDVTMTDLSTTAWRDGQRIRRRRRGAAGVGGTAATVLVMAIGVQALGTADNGPSLPAAPTSTTTIRPDQERTTSRPDATYSGAPVWVAPRRAEERDLPRLAGTGLPAEIDLSPVAPSAAGIGRAVGLLGVSGEDGHVSRVTAVGTDGTSYSVPIAGTLDRVQDEEGNVISSLTSESLAPDGSRAFFVQESSLAVYDFQTGVWTHIATPRWLAESARWLTGTEVWVPDQLGETGSGRGTAYDVNDPLEPRGAAMAHSSGVPWSGDDEAFGPVKSAANGIAQSYFLTESVKLGGKSYSGLDAVVAAIDDKPRLLVFAPLDERWKGCCPVVGWTGSDTVLVESRQADARVLAWRVGSHDVRQVSTIVGWVPGQEAYVASWALPDS